jgi:hypothetical protein
MLRHASSHPAYNAMHMHVCIASYGCVPWAAAVRCDALDGQLLVHPCMREQHHAHRSMQPGERCRSGRGGSVLKFDARTAAES